MLSKVGVPSLEFKHPNYLVAVVFLLTLLSYLIAPPQTQAQASLSLSPTSGTVGTDVTITGNGFTSRFVAIYWDDQVLAPKIKLSEDGKINYRFKVPPSPRGEHSVKIKGNDTLDIGATTAIFTVIPHVTIFPDVGKAHIPITITGSGFTPFEKNIKILWDNTELPISTNANYLGSWGVTFEVPDSEKGEHFIIASGSVTTAEEVGVLKFTISPVAKAEPTSGAVGTEVKISGVGFRTGEDGITITYDGEIIQCNIVGGADGSWNTTVTVPASTSGYHIIGVYGSSFTPKGTVPDIPFRVIPKIELQPAVGSKGDKVILKGTGFASNEKVTFSFDDLVLDNMTADSLGCFELDFRVPQSSKGKHTITASGDSGNSASASFSVEKTPPLAPQPLQPKDKAKLEIFSSPGKLLSTTTALLIRTIVFWKNSSSPTSAIPQFNLEWADATRDSEVTYALQISQGWNNDFSLPVLIEENLTETEYRFNLSQGCYTWRVKAVDDIGNESPWSEPQQFQVVVISPHTLALSLAIPISIAGIAIGLWILVQQPQKTS